MANWFLAFTSIFLFFAGIVAAQAVNTTRTGWFPGAKYGLEDTYAFGRLAGETNGYLETVDSFLNLPPNIDSLANSFNAVQYANDLAAFGVDYLEFTAWHADMNLLYPSHVMDSARGVGHSCKRDLIQDLITAVHAKGIKVILYVHPADGHDMSLADQIALGWNSAAGVAAASNTQWMNFQDAIFNELCSRYATSIDGFFFDGLWSHHLPEIAGWVNPAPIAAIIHQYNPNAVVIDNNTGINAACEYNTQERYPTTTSLQTYGSTTDQVQLLLGTSWWADTPYTINVCKFSPENILRWTIFQSGCSRSGGMCWGTGSYWKGGWQGGIQPALTQVGNYLTPISSAIRNTYPSTSYPLIDTTHYSAMPHGIVAFRSPDNTLEYIHVLKPPTGTTLTLPLPADGKVFTSATMVPSGLGAALTQDTAVHISISTAWDSVNTVIKLAVNPASIRNNVAFLKPVSASSTVTGSGWAMAYANDDQVVSTAYSMGWSSSNTLASNHTEWILVSLGAAHTINEVDLYPRTDASNIGYGFPVNFTIQVSTDSLTWTTVTTQTGYAKPAAAGAQRFSFTAQSAKYVKITGTSLRSNPNDAGQYRMQFAELEVFGTPATSVVPAQEHGSHFSPLPDRSYRTVTGRLMLDPMYEGKSKTVNVYDLSGRMIVSKIIKTCIIDIKKDFGIAADGVYFIKIKAP